MDFKQKINSLFMSKEQTIYLFFLFFSCIAYGSFSATYAYYEIGKGTRFYSLLISLGCIIGVVHAFIAADIKKKRWVFCHYKAIDLGESIFFTLTEMGFLIFYFSKGMNPTIDELPVLNLFFVYFIFYRIVNAVISVVIPGVGNVFEQSLYKNQIDYQNHSNAENMMCCFGAALGAGASFLIGDYFKEHPYWGFCLVFVDWIGLLCRWQFYFKPSNYSMIIRKFAKDSGEKLREMNKRKTLSTGV